MEDSLGSLELQIPEFEHLSTRLGCIYCSYPCEHARLSRSSAKYSRNLLYRFDCERTLKRISIVKLLYEILVFCLVTILNLINFSKLWISLLIVFFTFIFLLLFDLCTEHIIHSFFIYYEKRKRKKYDIKVKQLQEKNETLLRAKAGITKEVQEFLDSSKVLYQKLSLLFENIQSELVSTEKNEQRVILKMQQVLKELEILNGKLSKDNFESSYITTLYEIHLPKLLEYSLLFSEHLSSGTLTSKQIVEFSNLLEVFKVKISKHTEYLQQKIEDDFLIKMKALNEDVLPNFDGSEEQNNE